MIIVMVLLIVVLVVGAVVMLKKQNLWAAGGCAALALILAIGQMVSGSRSGRAGGSLVDKEKQAIATVLAQRIAERHPGKRVAILAPPMMEGAAPEESGNQGIQELLVKAFEINGITAEITPLPLDQIPGDPSMPMLPVDGASHPMMMYVQLGLTVNQLNAVLHGLQGSAEVVIYPMDVYPGFIAGQLLPAGKGPHLVLMDTRVMDFKSALKSTVLDAVLQFRPDDAWQGEQKWPKDDVEAFDRRYVLATRDNPAL